MMRFDNLINYDIMTGLLYVFISFLLILIFRFWRYSLHYVIQYVKEFKIHSVETKREVSQKSSVEIVTYVKQKRDQ